MYINNFIEFVNMIMLMIKNVYQDVVMQMNKNLDHVNINMIVVVKTATVEQVKNSVILLMVVNLNLVFVVAVKTQEYVLEIIIAVVKKDTVVLLMHSVLLIMDVNQTLVIVLLMEIHVQMLRKHQELTMKTKINLNVKKMIKVQPN